MPTLNMTLEFLRYVGCSLPVGRVPNFKLDSTQPLVGSLSIQPGGTMIPLWTPSPQTVSACRASPHGAAPWKAMPHQEQLSPVPVLIALLQWRQRCLMLRLATQWCCAPAVSRYPRAPLVKVAWAAHTNISKVTGLTFWSQHIHV